MSASDVLICAVNALLSVLWIGFWYGLVSEILGSGWGFLVVFILVFVNNLLKREKSAKQEIGIDACAPKETK